MIVASSCTNWIESADFINQLMPQFQSWPRPKSVANLRHAPQKNEYAGYLNHYFIIIYKNKIMINFLDLGTKFWYINRRIE